MASSIMTNVYNQFSTTYMSSKALGRYDTHKRSELKNICHSMAKLNRDTPLYLIDNSADAKRYVVGLKEEARELGNAISSALGDVDDSSFYSKIAYSSNENVVSAKYIGHQATTPELTTTQDGSDAESSPADGSVLSTHGEVPTYEIEVQALASPQVNLGNFIPMNSLDLEPNEYSFDITVNDMGYEFQFNINESDTNHDIQQRLCRLINNSKIGLNATILEDGDGNAAMRLESTRVGIDYGQNSRVFEVSDNNTSRNSGVVPFLGINYVTREATNARFTVNGIEASATSNTFILQNEYEISLNGLSENEGQTTTVGVKPDTEALQENITSLIGSYNNFIKSVSEYRNSQSRSNDLLKEVNRITGFYKQEMEKLGIAPSEDGTLSLDSEQLTQSVSTEETTQAIDSLKSFSQSMLRKSRQISLNPVSYLNKTIVAYKNPSNTFMSPYVTSAYAGMLFNNYC